MFWWRLVGDVVVAAFGLQLLVQIWLGYIHRWMQIEHEPSALGFCLKRPHARILLAAMLSLLLGGCGNIEDQQIGASDYFITGRATFGALGGAASASQLARRASELCSNGYDITSERSWVFEGPVIEWRVRCK